MDQFAAENYHHLCDLLAEKDPDLNNILQEYGYPPFWTRPNTFETLVLTILEQQVSLASAYAAYKKLKEKMGTIEPDTLLLLRDEDLRDCYVSRQKIAYTRGLAQALLSENINLTKLYDLPDEVVRTTLKKLKGIGDWTVDIYLIHALKRADIFPVGDLALVNAIKMIKNIQVISKEALYAFAEPWKPYRSIATMMLWHHYIRKKKINLLH